MKALRVSGLAIACMVGAVFSPNATAGEASLATPGGMFNVRVTSLKEARFGTVVRQVHDYSCGSAALATLLTYHYNRPTNEEAAFTAMFEVGDREAIQKFGFSLADMQRYLAAIGYRSDGYRIPIDKIAEAGIPGITLINTKGYNHFVVIKGIKDGDVLIGDPAAGVKHVPVAEFVQGWQGIFFIIRDDLATGQANFNRSEEWMVRRKAPFGTALSRDGLASFTSALPGLREF